MELDQRLPEYTVIGNNLDDYAFYSLDDVPYVATPSYNEDAQGNVIDVDYSYTNLPNTVFFALNTQACFAKNTGLIETFGDPGKQLEEL